MRRTRRRALTLMSGIWSAPTPPRGGWHRNDPGDGGGDGSAGGGPAGGGANDGAGDDDKAGDDKKPKLDGDFDKDRYERTLGSARAGEKAARQEAKEAKDRLNSVLKALGLGSDGKADPETQAKELTDRATAAEQRAEALAVQLAVRDAATKHSANTAELLDSTKFLGQLKELDVTASDYGDKVAALVAKAVKDNPARYGTGTAKGGTRSGSSDHTGGGNGPARSANLQSAIAKKMAG
jgi:hypothetical protein